MALFGRRDKEKRTPGVYPSGIWVIEWVTVGVRERDGQGTSQPIDAVKRSKKFVRVEKNHIL